MVVMMMVMIMESDGGGGVDDDDDDKCQHNLPYSVWMARISSYCRSFLFGLYP